MDTSLAPFKINIFFLGRTTNSFEAEIVLSSCSRFRGKIFAHFCDIHLTLSFVVLQHSLIQRYGIYFAAMVAQRNDFLREKIDKIHKGVSKGVHIAITTSGISMLPNVSYQKFRDRHDRDFAFF